MSLVIRLLDSRIFGILLTFDFLFFELLPALSSPTSCSCFLQLLGAFYLQGGAARFSLRFFLDKFESFLLEVSLFIVKVHILGLTVDLLGNDHLHYARLEPLDVLADPQNASLDNWLRARIWAQVEPLFNQLERIAVGYLFGVVADEHMQFGRSLLQ